MKTMISNFGNAVLSREQMKKVKGAAGSCSTSGGQPFAAIDNEDAKTTVLLICGPCNYTCHWE